MFSPDKWLANPSTGFYPHTIGQSLRFNDNDSAYLHRTPSSASNRKTFTFSCWVKRGNLGIDTGIFQQRNDANTSQQFLLQFRSGNNLRLLDQPGTGGNSMLLDTSALFRDTSAWYHIVASVDTTDGTASDRAKLYVNGERITSFVSTTNYSTQNYDTSVNNTVRALIGVQRPNSSATLNSYFDGYIAEVNLIDGQALTANSFGETKDGIWIPKAYSGSYGDNGFHLDFADSSAIGNDVSGQNNDFTVSGGGSPTLVASDVVPDSPTNNFSTLNPLYEYWNPSYPPTISEGNLRTYTASNYWATTLGSMGVSSGKWYAEFFIAVGASPASVAAVGILDIGANNAVDSGNFIGNEANSVSYYGSNGVKYVSSTSGAYGNTWGQGDILGIALDLDAGTVKFYKNNTVQNSGTAAASSLSGTFVFGCAIYNTTAIVANFGQDSSFANTKTSGSANAADDNGIGEFYYAPPSGHLAVCSANLPEPAIIDGTEHFNTLLYTGNATARSISGVGLSPDWVWLKSRGDASGHRFYDVVRGATKGLSPESAGKEYTESGLTSFGSDGFSLGTQAGTNGTNDDGSGKSMVSWNWKAGGSASTIAAGSISSGVPSIASSVSANTTAGFSIVSLTTPSTGTFTFGHGLGVQPDMMIAKGRDNDGYSWIIYHRSLGAGEIISFSTSKALGNTTFLQNTHPSSSIVSGNTASFGTSQGYIAYCFASTEGYSKAGSYIGSGSVNPFVYTGFRPAWIMLKRSDDGTENWQIVDNKRNAFNGRKTLLFPDLSRNEADATNGVDFLSNGFKPRDAIGNYNTSGATYIYLAFADQPFKFVNAE